MNTELKVSKTWNIAAAGRVKRWARSRGPSVELTVHGKGMLPHLRVGNWACNANWSTLENTFL